MISFERYKKFVESVEFKGWKIELDKIAKSSGEISISYDYWAYKNMKIGKVSLPFSGKIGIDKNPFDNRVQMTKKELLEELRKIDREYLEYYK